MSEGFRPPYPGYDVLAGWDGPSWNDATREVVRRRLADVPPRRFFTPEEWELLEAVGGRLIPQPERAEPVPIAAFIDEKLHRRAGDGFRFADFPPQDVAWRRGLHAIDDEARSREGRGFRELEAARQDAVLRAVQEGEVRAPAWRELPARRFFHDLLLKHVAMVYYGHPAGWNEIGFGGPASPRGYVRMGFNERDPWEPGAPRWR